MTRKKFDCVEMKRVIQEKLVKEFEGLSDERVSILQNEKLESNKTLSSFVKKIRDLKSESVQTH